MQFAYTSGKAAQNFKRSISCQQKFTTRRSVSSFVSLFEAGKKRLPFIRCASHISSLISFAPQNQQPTQGGLLLLLCNFHGSEFILILEIHYHISVFSCRPPLGRQGTNWHLATCPLSCEPRFVPAAAADDFMFSCSIWTDRHSVFCPHPCSSVKFFGQNRKH